MSVENKIKLKVFEVRNMGKIFQLPEKLKIKWGHELRVDCSKPKPCANDDRVEKMQRLVRKLFGGEEKGTNIHRESGTSGMADGIMGSLRKSWRIIVTNFCSFCVRFYNEPLYFMMWFKWVLVPYNQESQRRYWHDTYLLIKIEWPIRTLVEDELLR